MRLEAVRRSLSQSRILKVLRGYRPEEDAFIQAIDRSIDDSIHDRKQALFSERHIRHGGNVFEDVFFPDRKPQ
jgi:hypothetical protein